ncbi:copper homeostasis protein CutC [Pseudoalteromonas piscicida]|uniref:copper homeostasis protein CutC n=1 Tax=Pseudoalteromonas piscicida TaxID=43662 RepID=UPI0030A97B19
MNLANNSGKNLEICLNSLPSDLLQQNVQTAFASGATRVELCSNLRCGGLTPATHAITAVSQLLPCAGECIVMLRNEAHFFIDATILKQLQRALELIAAAGATGVALGFIDHRKEIAKAYCQSLIASAKSLGLSVTFHRAFDAAQHWQHAADTLLELGVDRVLSAGSPWLSQQSAIQNITRLENLLYALKGEIELVIGGGVDSKSAATLWTLSELGPLSLHAHSDAHNANGEVCSQRVKALITAKQREAQ